MSKDVSSSLNVTIGDCDMYMHYVLIDGVGHVTWTDVYQITWHRYLSECYWIVPGTINPKDD